MERNKADHDRGQVGIGTLIVFIAMVLVAAIAAGVLINTAGFLQTQAQDTGEESTEQVADNLNVITQVGDVANREDPDNAGTAVEDQIDRLRVGLQPASGADDINLAKLTVQYVSDDEFANLVVGADTSSKSIGSSPPQAEGDTNPDNIKISSDDTQGEYAIDVITAENPGDIVMTDGKDRYELVIPLADDDDNNNNDASIGEDPSTSFDSLASASKTGPLKPLDEGEELELTITTEVGSQTVAFLQVPDSLSGPDGGSTVNL